MGGKPATGEGDAEPSNATAAEARPVSQVNPRSLGVLSLIDAREILAGARLDELPVDARKPLRDVACWLEDFLNRPHPLLGRSGEVCPWTRRTLDLGKLVLAPIASDEPAEVDRILYALLDEFSSMDPTKGADAAFRSIVSVFHRLEPHAAAEFIVATHTRLKPAFLGRGLMLGEFYPSCRKPGLRNPEFRPLRAPVPLLVIRQMVEPDVEFLLDRDDFVEAYLSTHRGRGRERLLRVLEQQPGSVAPERIPSLLELADRYRDSIPPSRRSSPRAS
jgi:Domain of unknown function (DUF6875)